MRVVIKKGHADWDDLIGKTISFKWSDGWDDYDPHEVVFEGTRPQEMVDPRYPRYYIMVDDGGYAVRENEEVTVTVHD